MSHLRNLFSRPSGQEHTPSAVPVAAVLEDRTAPAPAAFHLAPKAARALPEFTVEEARPSPEQRLVYHYAPRSPAAERIRLLRMRLKEHWSAGKLKRLLVTSALANDGKTTVLLNLATALAERGKRSVLVIEADLHHSSVAERLKLRSWAGLSECLMDDAMSPFSAIRRIEPLGWHLLPAGEPLRNPTELLQTPALGQVLQKLAPSFDWILIDSPPVISLTDSISLSQNADASLLVVRGGQTPREAVDQAIALLGKKNIVGVVLNGVEARDHLSYGYYDSNRDYQED